jgi:hypothetical protein
LRSTTQCAVHAQTYYTSVEIDARKGKAGFIRLALLIDAQGTWSGGMYLWIFEEITGGPVLMLRGWRAEQPLFPEQNLS